MTFYKNIESLRDFNFQDYFNNISDKDIENTLQKETLNQFDFLNLISPRGEKYLEIIAKKARRTSIQYFGKIIGLYIPLYIANFCENNCLYCGFKNDNTINRRRLTLAEIEKEAVKIHSKGMRHILILTGEDRENSSLEYLEDTVRLLKKYFSSISIEVYPMETDEYMRLKKAGIDGLTIYQEVYDQNLYKKLHTHGKKANFHYRLDTPERGASAGLRHITIGSLLGLGDKIKETFFTALHAKYLSDKYIDTEFCVSLPRLNKAEGNYHSKEIITDKDLVQFIIAYRLFLPRVGIALSTRERAELRDNLIPLGITRMSAGSKTSVGGYLQKEGQTPQFELSDDRDISEIVHAIRNKGYDPVFKDWELI